MENEKKYTPTCYTIARVVGDAEVIRRAQTVRNTVWLRLSCWVDIRHQLFAV